LTEKIKLEGSKRKKRRMRLKSKNANEAIIEKFSTQSCKSAKYAKTTIKKRDFTDAGSTQMGSTAVIASLQKTDLKNTSIEN
jgi:transcription elongation factor Elf1